MLRVCADAALTVRKKPCLHLRVLSSVETQNTFRGEVRPVRLQRYYISKVLWWKRSFRPAAHHFDARYQSFTTSEGTEGRFMKFLVNYTILKIFFPTIFTPQIWNMRNYHATDKQWHWHWLSKYVYKWQWRGPPTHCASHMFTLKTWIYEPVNYLNSLVFNAQ